jgi:hypothetical protein
MIDFERSISDLRKGYVRARGTQPTMGARHRRSGQLLAAGRDIPRTTWEDVIAVAAHLERYADPTDGQCIELLQKHRGMTKTDAMMMCAFNRGARENPRGFVRTESFLQAQEDFRSAAPLTNPIQAAMKVGTFELYPRNEEFWGYANRYAIARRAAGAVPFWSELAIESLIEATKELPQTVQNALSAVDPRKLLPDPEPWANLIKWGTIATGLVFVYLYAMRK